MSDNELMHLHAALLDSGTIVRSKSAIIKTMALKWYNEHGYNQREVAITQATIDICKPASSLTSQALKVLQLKEAPNYEWLNKIHPEDRTKAERMYLAVTTEDATDPNRNLDISFFLHDERNPGLQRIAKLLIKLNVIDAPDGFDEAPEPQTPMVDGNPFYQDIRTEDCAIPDGMDIVIDPTEE